MELSDLISEEFETKSKISNKFGGLAAGGLIGSIHKLQQIYANIYLYYILKNNGSEINNEFIYIDKKISIKVFYLDYITTTIIQF